MALRFKEARLLGAGERVEPLPGIAGALSVHTPSLPDVYELNLVLAPRGADPATVDRVRDQCEQVQGAAGLRHRKLRLRGEGMEGSSSLLGEMPDWTVDRELIMIRSWPPDRAVDPPVLLREVSADELAPSEDEFLRAEPHAGDAGVRRQLIGQHRRWERAAPSARRLAIVEAARPTAWCRVYDDGAVAEVDTVSVLPGERGRGLGRALMDAVLREVPAERLLFLCADAEDWPRELYGRLGFDVVGERLGATRLLGPAES